MSLDLTKIAAQVAGMVARLKARRDDERKRLNRAMEVLFEQSANIDSLKKKIISSQTTWLVADLIDGLDRRYQVLPLPPDFTVIATDGSHIDVDRHRSTRCYLINIGGVVLRYGSEPEAHLDSSPSLYAGDEDMVITPAGARGREQTIEGALLGIKRSVEECRRLSELTTELPPGSSALALLDGSLILWGLEAYPEFVTEALLEKGFLGYLAGMRNAGQGINLALASYISFPRSTDVVNVLRVALCPNDPLDTDQHCPNCQQRECEAVAGVRDRELFANLLSPGDRSALFTSQSSIVKKHYGDHWIYFFYLRVDDEIARVEVPQWVAMNESLLNLAHGMIIDQCRRGQGYPVALSEAHEQAVVTGADRENFWALVESAMVDEQLPTTTSVKSQSKRTRWV